MTIHDRLKKARDLLGMSQSALAKAAGASLPAWQGYEAGKNIPGGKALQGLARLGININWLLTGEGEARIDQGGDNFIADQFRKMRGYLSVKEFVKKVGFGNPDLAEKTIERIEAEKEYPSYSFMLVIFEQLDINPLWLWGYTEQPMYKAQLNKAEVDYKLLREIIEEAVIHESVSDNQLPADKKAKLIIELYKKRVENKAG
jgi:transcriptional regulator with XRE-family HTH domain